MPTPSKDSKSLHLDLTSLTLVENIPEVSLKEDEGFVQVFRCLWSQFAPFYRVNMLVSASAPLTTWRRVWM